MGETKGQTLEERIENTVSEWKELFKDAWAQRCEFELQAFLNQKDADSFRALCQQVPVIGDQHEGGHVYAAESAPDVEKTRRVTIDEGRYERLLKAEEDLKEARKTQAERGADGT